MMIMILQVLMFVAVLAVAEGKIPEVVAMENVHGDEAKMASSSSSYLYLRNEKDRSNYINVNHRYVEQAAEEGKDIDDAATFVPSTTPSPSSSFVPSTVPSDIPSGTGSAPSTTFTDTPTSPPIWTVTPAPCNSTIDTQILPQVQYSLYNKDRDGGDEYAFIYQEDKLTYRPCLFSILATITSFTPPLVCAPPSTNFTIQSVRMKLSYYNETTNTVEIVEDHIERFQPYFLYGNNNETINTNIDYVSDGKYSIQSTVEVSIAKEGEEVTIVKIPTAPIYFTFFPCV